MRRRPAHLVARISLALCVAVCVLWVWSYAQTPGVVHVRPGRTSGVMAYRGRLMFETAGRIDEPVWPGVAALRNVRFMAPRSQKVFMDASRARPRAVLGFQWYRRSATIVPTRQTAVTVPWWFVAAALLAAPARWWAHTRRARVRRERGLCIRCGYDLRGTPGLCPECGLVPNEAAASSAEA